MTSASLSQRSATRLRPGVGPRDHPFSKTLRWLHERLLVVRERRRPSYWNSRRSLCHSPSRPTGYRSANTAASIDRAIIMAIFWAAAPKVEAATGL